jgi:hypothetical protein
MVFYFEFQQAGEKLRRSPSTVLRTNGGVLISLGIFRSCPNRLEQLRPSKHSEPFSNLLAIH